MYDQVNTASAADHTEVGSRIDPVLARSWLLVNGAHADRFESAERSRADIVVLDIEDAVAPKDKDAAREHVVRWLSDGHSDWVRINGFGTPWWAKDIAQLADTGVGGVMLAMVESVDHVTETARRLPNVPIVALVETARGWSASPKSPLPKALSVWRSVSATSGETPASVKIPPRWPTHGRDSPSRQRPPGCRARSTVRPSDPIRSSSSRRPRCPSSSG